MQTTKVLLTSSLLFCLAAGALAEETPLPQKGEYAPAMRKVNTKFQGREGVVLHVGDSITYASPYGAWARYGQGRSEQDRAILKWMHAGDNNDTDGWWLCSVDRPGGRSDTACSGIRADEMLAGGKSNLPPLSKILDQYRPRMMVVMLGTNDASADRKVEDFRRDMEKIVSLAIERGIVPIVSTIPPHVHKPKLAAAYNESLRDLAKQRELPLIDFEAEILKRHPQDWDGTLLNKGDVHPTTGKGEVNAGSAPTAEHLAASGYLLRGWLSLKKIAEVKHAVLD